VRGYLDFDVDMENVRDFWLTSDALITEYVREQTRTREKQKALREEWERFKSAQNIVSGTEEPQDFQVDTEQR
jgi:hypothetical protein